MSKLFQRVFNRNSPALDIRREFYTMSATVNGDEAEVIMYGDIVQDTPRDWWTNEPLEGNYIVLEDFLGDLEQLQNAKKITVRLNSCGGDAYAAIPIHNRLRELKAEVTAIVDGVAMSGGSLIMCAADKVLVNPSSLIMIHKCWRAVYGGYSADELRKVAASNDAVDKAQAAIYTRKTGIDEAGILSMMTEETYMTGREAVDKGFADELMDAEPVNIAASADRQTLYVNGRARRLPYPLSGLPENIPTVEPAHAFAAQTNTQQPLTTGGTKGGTPMATTLEELRKENPELANQFMAEAQAAASLETGSANEAVEAERSRLKEIDEVSALFDDTTVREAKYGEKACTAQEMAYRAAQKAAKEGKKFLSDLQEDTQASGAQKVEATPGAEDGAGGAEGNVQAAAKQAAEAYKKMMGGK